MSPVLSLTFCKSLLDMSRCWMGSSFKILLLQIPPLFLNFLSKIARILIECQHLYPHHHPPAHLHLLLPCLQPPTHPPLPMPLIWLTFFFLQSVSSSSPTLLPLICTTLELLKLNPRLRQFQHPLSDASSTKIYHHHNHTVWLRVTVWDTV